MSRPKKTSARICKNGHRYIKSSNCPTCPVCEASLKPEEGFLALLAAPARRAMQNNGITSLKQLSRFKESDVLSFHGIGKTSLPVLHKCLAGAGLKFKK